MDAKQKNLNVQLTEKNLVICECGSNAFIPLFHIAVAKNPIIGKPDINAPIPAGHMCYACHKNYPRFSVGDLSHAVT